MRTALRTGLSAFGQQRVDPLETIPFLQQGGDQWVQVSIKSIRPFGRNADVAQEDEAVETIGRFLFVRQNALRNRVAGHVARAHVGGRIIGVRPGARREVDERQPPFCRPGADLGAHSDKHLLYCSWEDRDSLLVTKKEFIDDLEGNYAEMAAFGIRREDAGYFLPPYEWYSTQISAWTPAFCRNFR